MQRIGTRCVQSGAAVQVITPSSTYFYSESLLFSSFMELDEFMRNSLIIKMCFQIYKPVLELLIETSSGLVLENYHLEELLVESILL